MPMGLGDAIKKRTSGEFKMEQKGSSMSFSQTQASEQSQSMVSSSRQLGSFQEETNESIGSQMQKSSFETSSSMQSSSLTSSHESSSMKMSSSKSMSSSLSSKTVASSFQESQLNTMETSQSQNQEIKQDNLKTQIVSAITDLEGDRDLVDFSKENRTIDLMSPAQAKSPTPKATFTPTKQDPFSPAKQDLFSPPPLEQVYEQPQPEPQLPMSNGASHTEPLAMDPPARNGLQNGFNEFVASKSMEMQQIQEFTQSTTSTTRVNGIYEETGSIQESGGSNPMLQKIMTPASMEYDTGSLKKKDPKKMFTDSSFYNSKYHPTIADQVEMAHKLSSAMFNEQNKGTKGAKMYLTRMENSGGFGDDTPKHDNVPNMKLVMNPEGKVHVWDDLPLEQRPDMGQLATHAAPNLSLPDVADPVAESLQAGVGRGGELFNKRKQKADSWIVDESTIGRINPGAVADKFIQEQSQQQLATQQQKLFEHQQKQQIQHEQLAAREADQLQQQREAQQTFMQQQQFKQEQSMEVRRIQEMAQQQIDFPQDFQHTSLKARSYTPSLDLGCHNVQGINVWANTAPRGWGSSRTGGTPTRGAVATPGPGNSGAAEGEMMARMEETRLREEEERRLMQEERLRMEEEQHMESVRMQQQQEEQLRLKQEREEQMRREQEEMMRQEEERRRLEQEKLQLEEERRRLEEERFRQEELRRQEEEMRRQQEEMKRQEAEQLRLEQMRQQEQEQRQEQEEMFRQAEIKRQDDERQRQEQMQMQQQQEQMIIQQQREQMQMQQQQMQQQQQREQQQQMQMQQQQQFTQQQQQQMQQQQMVEQQQMMFQQQQLQTSSMTTQEQKISSITKAGGFSYGAIPSKQPKSQPQEAALPPMSSSFESSQSQQFSSVQQSSSSFSAQQQSQSEIYESQEFNGGVMKGYRRKDEASTNGNSHEARDSGIFTGINGDANSLVDETFDYKKHTVKDLAAHFALVKPKQNIPSNILPEQRNFNGGQAPQLNYLGANEAGATVNSQQTARRELSQQDIEASKQAYEMKKKQQMEAKQTTTTTTTTDSSSVVRRTTETSSEQKSERRMSLRDSLMLDPAQAHADAGLIDPSAILRGSDITGRKSTTEGMNQSSVEGETDKVMNKWDNHNTIARGWAGMSKNYQPVTFRSIYNIGNKQESESSFQL